MKAIRIHEFGGPEVMRSRRSRSARPGRAGAVRQRAVGLNYIDVYMRNGALAAKPPLPLVPGSEGAGDIVAVGPGVTAVGRATGSPTDGARRLCGGAADRRRKLVRLPDGISYETGAVMMLKGLTAQYLLRRTFRVSRATRSSCMPRPAASA